MRQREYELPRLTLPSGFSEWLESPDAWLLREDVKTWSQRTPQARNLPEADLIGRISVLSWMPEFMTLLDFRCSKSKNGKLFNLNNDIKRANDLYIRCDDVGPGIFIQHGHSTWILATKIGKNLFINQNVTIGSDGRGIPEIGDNVVINTGAVVVGRVRIGNNSRITANSVVYFNVPDDHVTYPAKTVLVPKRR